VLLQQQHVAVADSVLNKRRKEVEARLLARGAKKTGEKVNP
jgi:hypothetical protein